MCFHEGPTVVHRFASVAPRIFGPCLNREEGGAESEGGAATAAHAAVDPPALSVAQSWKLGALHERFVRAREESNLREAGDVLGRPRPLTEVFCLVPWYWFMTRGRLAGRKVNIKKKIEDFGSGQFQWAILL